MVGDVERGGIIGMEVDQKFLGVEFSEDGAFVGARLSVPLGGGSSAGEEGEGVVVARRFGER